MRGHDRRGTVDPADHRPGRTLPRPGNAYVELQADERRVSRIAYFARAVDELAGHDPVAAADHGCRSGRTERNPSSPGLHRVGLMGENLHGVRAGEGAALTPHPPSLPVRYLRLQWPDLDLREPLGTALYGAATPGRPPSGQSAGVPRGAGCAQLTAAARKVCTLVKKSEAVDRSPGELLDIVLGVRHQADHVAAGVGDPGDVVARPVGVRRPGSGRPPGSRPRDRAIVSASALSRPRRS